MARREKSVTREPLPKGFVTIWITVALDLVGFGIVVPILGRYAERFGASGLEVGLLFASFSLAQLVFSPILGKLSDRIGRKPVILISLLGTAIGSFVTGAAGALWVLFLGRVLDGASGASVAVAQGAVTDVAAPHERPRLLGLLGAAFGVGFVVGPAVGGLAALASVAAVFVGVGLTLVGVQTLLVRPVNSAWGTERSVQAGLALNTAGLVVLSRAEQWPFLVVALLLLTVGQGLVTPNLSALVSGRVPDHRRGEALGFQQGVNAVGRVAGPAVAGLLYDHVSIGAPYLVGGALCGVALLVVSGAHATHS
jgi:MFS family permease